MDNLSRSRNQSPQPFGADQNYLPMEELDSLMTCGRSWTGGNISRRPCGQGVCKVSTPSAPGSCIQQKKFGKFVFELVAKKTQKWMAYALGHPPEGLQMKPPFCFCEPLTAKPVHLQILNPIQVFCSDGQEVVFCSAKQKMYNRSLFEDFLTKYPPDDLHRL